MSVTFTEEQIKNNVLVVSLNGTLDAPNAMSIEDNFKDTLTNHRGDVIVNLAGVDYMSSYGLRMLLVGAKTLKTAGYNFHLAAPNEHVLKVITVAGYNAMFPVYETLEEAIDSVAA